MSRNSSELLTALKMYPPSPFLVKYFW